MYSPKYNQPAAAIHTSIVDFFIPSRVSSDSSSPPPTLIVTVVSIRALFVGGASVVDHAENTYFFDGRYPSVHVLLLSRRLIFNDQLSVTNSIVHLTDGTKVFRLTTFAKRPSEYAYFFLYPSTYPSCFLVFSNPFDFAFNDCRHWVTLFYIFSLTLCLNVLSNIWNPV